MGPPGKPHDICTWLLLTLAPLSDGRPALPVPVLAVMPLLLAAAASAPPSPVLLPLLCLLNGMLLLLGRAMLRVASCPSLPSHCWGPAPGPVVPLPLLPPLLPALPPVSLLPLLLRRLLSWLLLLLLRKPSAGVPLPAGLGPKKLLLCRDLHRVDRGEQAGKHIWLT